MDNLTHGLLGLAIGALRRPDLRGDLPARDALGAPLPGSSGIGRGGTTPTDRAVLFACVVAAELPDLDTLLPAANPVLHALYAHRGISHALVFAPIWAAVATAVAWLVFRRPRLAPVFGYSLLSVLVAHLLADLWTGWGTRVLLPFSGERLSLDFAGVIDPFFTLPLLAGAIWALARRERWRRALLIGLALSTLYMGGRIGSRVVLLDRVETSYPEATRVEVFPALLSPTGWRYVAVLPGSYAAGEVSLFGEPELSAVHSHSDPLPALAAENFTVSEAVAWARLPLAEAIPREGGGLVVRVADLRYHMGGDPTLELVIVVGPGGETLDARMERGGSPKELLERWRG